jgi:threonine dehydratase
MKLENLQETGSFKLRGAVNKVLSLGDEERARGLVAASTGNHGAAVAAAGAAAGAPVRVFVPETASQAKLARIEAAGGEISRVGGDPINAERAARKYARDNDLSYVSPYNDEVVVAGQATVGSELVRQCDSAPEEVFVALGGGGLCSGVAHVVKAAWPQTRVIACSPENSCVMIRSIQAGRIVEAPSLPTLSDGTAGGIESDTITLELCRRSIDEFVTVSEEEIARALRFLVEREALLVEGAAAVAAAGFMQRPARSGGSGPVIVILSGANITNDLLLSVLSDPA